MLVTVFVAFEASVFQSCCPHQAVQHQQLSQLVIISFSANRLGYVFPIASDGCS